MIGKIISGLFSFVIGLINLLLAPIDALILAGLPDVASALSSVTDFFSFITNGLSWAIGFSLLPPVALQLISMYFGFLLVFPVGLASLKLILAWYRKIMP